MSNPVKRPAPLSVRLTQLERDDLLARAGSESLSTYVKKVLFGDTLPLPRDAGLVYANRTILAHLLATLGASRIAPNLDRLAHEAEVGNLSADEETTVRVREACEDVRLVHNALMRALGMREKVPSLHETTAMAAFKRAAKPEGSLN